MALNCPSPYLKLLNGTKQENAPGFLLVSLIFPPTSFKICSFLHRVFYLGLMVHNILKNELFNQKFLLPGAKEKNVFFFFYFFFRRLSRAAATIPFSCKYL